MIFFAVPCHDVERHVIEAISKGAFLVVLERGNADLASVNGVLCEVISEDLNCESIGGFIEKIKPSEDGPSFIGPLSKPSKSEFWEGDTEHRSGAYLDVREHSSTGSTYPK
ncbi:MAG: palindromic element RPE1 domain-containing protein, partial [Holosporales bacterium]|nr:palindromic element RPE1 domain-containing protein [Holosporales bacterium]